MPASEKNRDLKVSSSPRLLCKLIPRQNELSSGGMVEYLAYSFVWNGRTWKNFSGPKKVFSSSRRLLCNHAKINFQTLAWWNIWPIALFGMPAPEKIGTAKVFFFPLPPLQPNTTPKKNQAVAWWNIWPIALFGMPAPEKTFRGLKSFFFPPPPLQPDTTPKWTFKPWHGGISCL